MKSFQPRQESPPPDDGGRPDNPPATRPDETPDETPDQRQPENAPMTRPVHRNHNAEIDFRGETRSNATHASTTDPDARLFKTSAGTGAILCFMGEEDQKTVQRTVFPTQGSWMRRVPPFVRGTRRKATA